ncbi:sulfurtransferase TusA family protein [candidate division CSSED10-310 bacterium]|uniref:Sulfurtransferase TusA family protein n=1 Tax=candidate division CSSED10-310 bacterium TaxID=2855610 RepID=A0ABV6YVI6_UNCC1
MATIILDTKGLKCPQPILKIAAKLPELSPGDILQVMADCPTFEDDVKKWCTRMKKTLLAVTKEGEVKIAQIQF